MKKANLLHQYEVTHAAYLNAVQYRRDKQTELARAMAREQELAGRVFQASKDLWKK